jgi:hypothetical protein
MSAITALIGKLKSAAQNPMHRGKKKRMFHLGSDLSHTPFYFTRRKGERS